VDVNSKNLEAIMFNWNIRASAQEIFAFTLAFGVLLTLATVIPA
jgi:hypothetical protein